MIAMKMVGKIFVCGLALLGATFGTAARAEDPAFLTIGAGGFDVHDDHKSAQFAVEYRSDYKLWKFKPFGGLMVNTDHGADLYMGIALDVYFGRRFVVTPNFAPSLYLKGGSKDLGFPLEFRSGIEFAYRFDDYSRLGLAVHHLSNASIDDNNPGTELVTLYYSVPFDKVGGWF